MWSNKNGKIVLDRSKIRSDFRIVSQDGLHLICPKKNMWDWNEEEKWLRSIVVDDNGYVVSCAWKKFGNYGEFQTDTAFLDKALKENKTVHFTHKEDGSLCIRSVIDNKIMMRTRGTMYGDYAEEHHKTFNERFQKVAEEKYPALMDPSLFPDRSLLFEYVSPTNRIVIGYKEDDLIFLGFIIHADLRIGTWPELEMIAESFNFNLVKRHELPRDPEGIINIINDWDDEGIVARCNFSPSHGPNGEVVKDQVLVKVKSAKYLAKHRMKFSMNYKFMVEFIGLSAISSELGLVNKLQECDYDWETIEAAKTLYGRYQVAFKAQNKDMKTARRLHSEFMAEILPAWAGGGDPVATRKEYAQLACAQGGTIRPMMFCLYDGKIDRLNALCKKFLLTEGKGRK